VIEEKDKVVVPKIDSETRDESDSEGVEVRLSMDMPSPTPTSRKLTWLTQTLQETREHVGAPRSLVKVSVPPRRYASHVALVSSIYMTFQLSIEQERCDTLMEDDVEIDSRFAAEWEFVEYRDRVDEFSQTERV
jgi:hypothetical protein